MKILVIAPHPDDEVLGAGGTIKKFTEAKHSVHLCIVTKAYPPDWDLKIIKKKKEEVFSAGKQLGINQIYFLNYPTAKLDTIPQKEIIDSFQSLIKKIKPDTIFSPNYGDINKDHRIVFEAILVATKPTKNNLIKNLLTYETLSSSEWGGWGYRSNSFSPNIYINIEKTIEAKIKAMKAYRTEIKPSIHPRSVNSIKTLARKRGSEAGLKYAESFMLIRNIEFI